MASSDSEPCSSRHLKQAIIDTCKHLVGYKTLWKNEFPWLEAVHNDGQVTGMLCRLCKGTNKKQV